jgi:Uma2 family endonuclease
MTRPAPIARISFAEYLAVEDRSDIRHEFLDGNIYAMAGGTPEHAALVAAFIQQLGNALRGKPCRVYSSDLRVRIRETGFTTYPDVTVICGQLETDTEDRLAAVNPLVLVEILSESTEAYDRGAKAAHYRRIPSLREYVLVSHIEPAIEVHRRSDAGHFELHEARKGERVILASLGIELDVDSLYADPLATISG